MIMICLYYDNSNATVMIKNKIKLFDKLLKY